jgi:hypothetical protein
MKSEWNLKARVHYKELIFEVKGWALHKLLMACPDRVGG